MLGFSQRTKRRPASLTEQLRDQVMSTRVHLPELDGVRGIAIGAVMFMHLMASLVVTSSAMHAIVKVSTYGVWGVDLFFVLSGFLITGILYDGKDGKAYFRNFYARRTLRIFPLYYAVLAVLFVFIPPSVLQRMDPQLLEARNLQVWVWLYLTNVYLAIRGSFAIPYVSHFWSLAVEEHFYLFWPVLVRYLSRSNIMRLSVAMAVFALVSRATLLTAGFNEMTAFVLTPCRLDALCVGAWFALAKRGPNTKELVKASPSLVSIATIAVVVSSIWHAKLGIGDSVVLPLRGFCLAILFGLAIFSVSAVDGPVRWKAFLRNKWLGQLGKYSYGLYIFHMLIVYWMERHYAQAAFARLLSSEAGGQLAQVVVALGLSILISVLSYEVFESRVLRLKKWFEYTPPRDGVEVAAELVLPDLAREPVREPRN